jgi:hypothetical protein
VNKTIETFIEFCLDIIPDKNDNLSIRLYVDGYWPDGNRKNMLLYKNKDQWTADWWCKKKKAKIYLTGAFDVIIDAMMKSPVLSEILNNNDLDASRVNSENASQQKRWDDEKKEAKKQKKDHFEFSIFNYVNSNYPSFNWKNLENEEYSTVRDRCSLGLLVGLTTNSISLSSTNFCKQKNIEIVKTTSSDSKYPTSLFPSAIIDAVIQYLIDKKKNESCTE